MNGQPQYDKASQVAETARALALALGRSPADQVVAIEDLEQAGREWAGQAESLQGFRTGADQEEAPAPLEERLAAVANDLNVAQVLLAAGIAAEEVEADVDGRELLRSSVSRLEDELASQRVAGEPTAGFAGQPDQQAPSGDPSQQLVQTSLNAVEVVVDGTLTVLKEAWANLRSLLPDSVTKALDGAEDILDAAPQIGRLLRLGLQAVKRALLALFELVPERLKAAARQQAREWWGESGESLEKEAVERLVEAEKVRDAAEKFQADNADPERLIPAANQLRELAARFDRLSQLLRRILRALAGAFAIATLFAVVVAAVGGWLPLAVAVGYLLAAGSVILIARGNLGDMLQILIGLART